MEGMQRSPLPSEMTAKRLALHYLLSWLHTVVERTGQKQKRQKRKGTEQPPGYLWVYQNHNF